MNGGYETMASFGPDVPAEVLRWAEGLPTVHEDAHRFYVHAGFRPGRPGPDPSEHVRLWMRKPFLSRDYDFGKHVVHGHTPLRTTGSAGDGRRSSPVPCCRSGAPAASA